MKWFDSLCLSKQMEYIFGSLLPGSRIEHDVKQQDLDIDLRFGAQTISVKYQVAAARTNNFSFEEMLYPANGRAFVGNFRKNRSSHYALIRPVNANVLGPCEAYLFESAYLHDVVPTYSIAPRSGERIFAPVRNNPKTEDGNGGLGASNWIVPIRDLLGNASVKRFNWQTVMASPTFQTYLLQNAPPR